MASSLAQFEEKAAEKLNTVSAMLRDKKILSNTAGHWLTNIYAKHQKLASIPVMTPISPKIAQALKLKSLPIKVDKAPNLRNLSKRLRLKTELLAMHHYAAAHSYVFDRELYGVLTNDYSVALNVLRKNIAEKSSAPEAKAAAQAYATKAQQAAMTSVLQETQREKEAKEAAEAQALKDAEKARQKQERDALRQQKSETKAARREETRQEKARQKAEAAEARRAKILQAEALKAEQDAQRYAELMRTQQREQEEAAQAQQKAQEEKEAAIQANLQATLQAEAQAREEAQRVQAEIALQAEQENEQSQLAEFENAEFTAQLEASAELDQLAAQEAEEIALQTVLARARQERENATSLNTQLAEQAQALREQLKEETLSAYQEAEQAEEHVAEEIQTKPQAEIVQEEQSATVTLETELESAPESKGIAMADDRNDTLSLHDILAEREQTTTLNDRFASSDARNNNDALRAQAEALRQQEREEFLRNAATNNGIAEKRIDLGDAAPLITPENTAGPEVFMQAMAAVRAQQQTEQSAINTLENNKETAQENQAEINGIVVESVEAAALVADQPETVVLAMAEEEIVENTAQPQVQEDAPQAAQETQPEILAAPVIADGISTALDADGQDARILEATATRNIPTAVDVEAAEAHRQAQSAARSTVYTSNVSAAAAPQFSQAQHTAQPTAAAEPAPQITETAAETVAEAPVAAADTHEETHQEAAPADFDASMVRLVVDDKAAEGFRVAFSDESGIFAREDLVETLGALASLSPEDAYARVAENQQELEAAGLPIGNGTRHDFMTLYAPEILAGYKRAEKIYLDARDTNAVNLSAEPLTESFYKSFLLEQMPSDYETAIDFKQIEKSFLHQYQRYVMDGVDENNKLQAKPILDTNDEYYTLSDWHDTIRELAELSPEEREARAEAQANNPEYQLIVDNAEAVYGNFAAAYEHYNDPEANSIETLPLARYFHDHLLLEDSLAENGVIGQAAIDHKDVAEIILHIQAQQALEARPQEPSAEDRLAAQIAARKQRTHDMIRSLDGMEVDAQINMLLSNGIAQRMAQIREDVLARPSADATAAMTYPIQVSVVAPMPANVPYPEIKTSQAAAERAPQEPTIKESLAENDYRAAAKLAQTVEALQNHAQPQPQVQAQAQPQQAEPQQHAAPAPAPAPVARSFSENSSKVFGADGQKIANATATSNRTIVYHMAQGPNF